jgi:hypothetical protein
MTNQVSRWRRTGPDPRLTGCIIAAIGLAAAVGTLSIGSGIGSGTWGPRAVPLLAALTLIAAGVGVALADFRAENGPSAEEGTSLPTPSLAIHDSDDKRSGMLSVGLLTGLAIGYVLVLDKTGYLLATALVSPLVFALFGMRSKLNLLTVCIAVPVVLHVIFFRLLAVFPPLGSWFDLTDFLPL